MEAGDEATAIISQPQALGTTGAGARTAAARKNQEQGRDRLQSRQKESFSNEPPTWAGVVSCQLAEGIGHCGIERRQIDGAGIRDRRDVQETMDDFKDMTEDMCQKVLHKCARLCAQDFSGRHECP